MSTPITAPQLKGMTRSIFLQGDQRVVLHFDFNAQCVLEELMRAFGLSPEEEEKRILQEAAAEDAAKEAGVPFKPAAPRGPGFWRTMAMFAFALSASYREDQGEPLHLGQEEQLQSYKRFERQLPRKDKSWVSIVSEVMRSEEDQGNEPSPAPEQTEPGASEVTEESASV